MEDFNKWSVSDLKEYLLQYDITAKDIQGSGKNGNVIKTDYIFAARQIGETNDSISKEIKHMLHIF